MLHFVRSLSLLLLTAGLLLAGAMHPQASPPSQQSAQTLVPPAAVPQQSSPPRQEPSGLNVVVLDPAHGGTDTGARGAGGIRESNLVLALTGQVRAALEKQGFTVLQTRKGDDGPSLDDRASLANAQRNAIFISLHVGSTGLPGTVRVYTLPAPQGTPPLAGALLPWERAQAAFLVMSRKLADLAQVQLSMRFKGSPANASAAAVRQLNSVALPAIAIELSNVSVQDPALLERMMPGVADGVAEAVGSFKQVYDAELAHGAPAIQPAQGSVR
ncbi:MAG: N-acetylmuramoyl-L-alanine amidase [Acidobacteriia bacterium]|nr:N-acetylmuramoyl-L-alanine amidase [Terriglobia bacterium]